MRALLFASALLVALPGRAEVDPALLKSLREGGYVLYLRHASTDSTQKDAPAMTNFEDCAKQRNLNEKGRGEARAIGEHVKRLRIPVGEVLASPLCRTMETARLAFGRAKADQTVRNAELLKKTFAAFQGRGANLAIASHAIPMHDDIKGLAEGEMAVVKPGGPLGFSIVGRIRADEWAKLKQ